MIIIGLTGGFATGKSTVSKILNDVGCFLIDADQIARQVVQQKKPAWKKIVKYFGQNILLSNGDIDRKKLGDIIFSNPKEKKILNQFTHPYIFRHILWQMACCIFRGDRIVVLDLPLLFERNYHKSYLLSRTFVVYCDEKSQMERLMKRNNFSKHEASERINAQLPLDEKCKLADVIIDNSKDLDFTKRQVINELKLLNKSWIVWKMRFIFLVVLIMLSITVYIFYKVVHRLIVI